MITETIASTKNVNSGGRELVIVTTKSGQVVWVNKAQFDDKAETISFNQHKEGSTWKGRDGKEGVRKTAFNEFVGTGKSSKFDVLDYIMSKGVTPTFALS